MRIFLKSRFMGELETCYFPINSDYYAVMVSFLQT
jgi:hypothetical protein